MLRSVLQILIRHALRKCFIAVALVMKDDMHMQQLFVNAATVAIEMSPCAKNICLASSA